MSVRAETSLIHPRAYQLIVTQKKVSTPNHYFTSVPLQCDASMALGFAGRNILAE